MNGTKIMKCTCEHEFQDSNFGKGYRLFNQTARVKPIVWRCTVCTCMRDNDGKIFTK